MFVGELRGTLLVDVLGLDIVNGDRAVLDQLLDRDVFQRIVFCPKGVGAIAST